MSGQPTSNIDSVKKFLDLVKGMIAVIVFVGMVVGYLWSVQLRLDRVERTVADIQMNVSKAQGTEASKLDSLEIQGNLMQVKLGAIGQKVDDISTFVRGSRP